MGHWISGPYDPQVYLDKIIHPTGVNFISSFQILKWMNVEMNKYLTKCPFAWVVHTDSQDRDRDAESKRIHKVLILHSDWVKTGGGGGTEDPATANSE